VYRAARALSLASKTGEALPHVDALRDWYAEDQEIYQGSLVMVAGMPAAFKSMFTLDVVRAMNVPTLYLSADSDPATQTSRLAAMVTGVNHASIRDQVTKDPEQEARVRAVLEDSHIQFSFDSNPDAYDMEHEVSAWVELYDEYPQVIIVDNLRNVFTGQDSEHSGYKMVQQMLIDLARETGACIITMHHMSESGNRKSTEPAPRSAIDGKVSQLPDLILSVAREGDQFRMVSIKNRHAVDHPEAEPEHWKTLRVEAATARFFAQDSLQMRANAFANPGPVGYDPTDENYYQ
jgi:replicative DNA helicase